MSIVGKKFNLRDRLLSSGKLTVPEPKKRTKRESSDGSGDMCSLTEEQKSYARERYHEVNASNSNLTPSDEGYITQDQLRDELNDCFGVDKSIRSYFRIWNQDETY